MDIDDILKDYYTEDLYPDTTASIISVLTEDEDVTIQRMFDNAVPTVTSEKIR